MAKNNFADGWRESTNVEVRAPGNAADRQFDHDLRNKRALLGAMLNEPQYIFQREEMEKWLNQPQNNPDRHDPFDEGGYVVIPSKGESALINHEAAKPGEPVKPMPALTAGSGVDRRTTTVALPLTGEEPNRAAKDAPAGPLPPSTPEIKLDKGMPEPPAQPKPIELPTKQSYDRVSLTDFMRTLPAFGQDDHGDSEIEA